jgi:uncharacterized membrane protein YidH (DUF202 family)
LSSEGAHAATGEPPTPAPEPIDPGLARDRTALAWTRSALNMAASGTLIARAAFTANLDVLGVVSAAAMATMALLTWRHGQVIYELRHRPGSSQALQTGAFGLLTGATVAIAAVAVIVTIAI